MMTDVEFGATLGSAAPGSRQELVELLVPKERSGSATDSTSDSSSTPSREPSPPPYEEITAPPGTPSRVKQLHSRYLELEQRHRELMSELGALREADQERRRRKALLSQVAIVNAVKKVETLEDKVLTADLLQKAAQLRLKAI